MKLLIFNKAQEIDNWVAGYIAKRIKQSSDKFVLGLPTGSTPETIYEKLINEYKSGNISFKNVITFNMDEYSGLKPSHRQSYNYFMWHKFFKHIDINPTNIHIPNGIASDLIKECENYEQSIIKAGGIDLFLTGIGEDGHLAFNEPGSSLNSVTRLKTLTEGTRTANSRFFKNLAEVPNQSITVGLKTIMNAREVITVAKGTKKALAVKYVVEHGINHAYPASILQNHSKFTFLVDDLATYELKVKTVNYFKSIKLSYEY